MSITTHERPGVYSSYGASSLIRGSGGRKTVGLVAVNTKATAKTVYTITSYEEAVTTFGSAGGQDMAELIRVILLNGAAAVAAVPIAASTDYEAGFAVLEGQENVSVVVCDSTTETDQQDLRDSVAAASAARREHIPAAAMIFCSRSFTAYPPGGGPPSPARRVGQSPSHTGRHDPPSRCRPAG